MSDDRLPTNVWVDAGLRRCSTENIPAVVRHKGDKMGGTVLLKITRTGIDFASRSEVASGACCRVLGQLRDIDGRLDWVATHDEDMIEEKAAEDYIARAVARDPDLWVIEVESDGTWHPFADVLG